MPPRIRITKESIVDAAIDLVREQGTDALTTRALANRLNCSTQPIFSNFPNMEALQYAVLEKAYALYTQRTFAAMRAGKYTPYKASGMAYIEFAVEEPQLFRLLYMRDRTGEEHNNDTAESEQIVRVIMQNTGLDSTRAHQLHEDLWMLVHGLAALYATGFEEYDEKKASAMLTDVYLGLLSRFQNMDREEQNDD